jgi:hypothetical protein
VTGGIARVVVVDPSASVELVDGVDEPGSVVPESTDDSTVLVSIVLVVHAPMATSMTKRRARRRSIFDQVIGHQRLDLTQLSEHGQKEPTALNLSLPSKQATK